MGAMPTSNLGLKAHVAPEWDRTGSNIKFKDFYYGGSYVKGSYPDTSVPSSGTMRLLQDFGGERRCADIGVVRTTDTYNIEGFCLDGDYWNLYGDPLNPFGSCSDLNIITHDTSVAAGATFVGFGSQGVPSLGSPFVYLLCMGTTNIENQWNQLNLWRGTTNYTLLESDGATDQSPSIGADVNHRYQDQGALEDFMDASVGSTIKVYFT